MEAAITMELVRLNNKVGTLLGAAQLDDATLRTVARAGVIGS